MTPSFGSRRRGKRLALPKHLWEKRREKRSRSYQSEHACSAPLRSCSLVSIFLSSERCNEGESRCPRSEAARTHRELLEGKVDRPGAASARRHVTPPGPKPTEGDAKARSIWG